MERIFWNKILEERYLGSECCLCSSFSFGFCFSRWQADPLSSLRWDRDLGCSGVPPEPDSRWRSRFSSRRPPWVRCPMPGPEWGWTPWSLPTACPCFRRAGLPPVERNPPWFAGVYARCHLDKKETFIELFFLLTWKSEQKIDGIDRDRYRFWVDTKTKTRQVNFFFAYTFSTVS